MSDASKPAKRGIPPANCTGNFAVAVNQRPMVIKSLRARLMLRPELAEAPTHWIWKIIADGKVGQKRTSIGLFFGRYLPAGTYDLVANEHIKIVYNESPGRRNVVYHSANLQTGQFTLLKADIARQQIKGLFSFGMSAIDFEVSDGEFDLQCR